MKGAGVTFFVLFLLILSSSFATFSISRFSYSLSLASAPTGLQPSAESSLHVSHIGESYGNWGGYVITTQSGAVTYVQAEWILPKLTCSSGLASFWVGIDGFSGRSVEQTGTDGTCNNRYRIWYEFFPKGSIYASFTAIAGDIAIAFVAYKGGIFTTSIIMTTPTGVLVGKFVHSQSFSIAKENSAEWVTEKVTSSYGDYNTMNFISCYAGINGINASITYPFANTLLWRMILADKNNFILAEPSPLSNSGTAFALNWIYS